MTSPADREFFDARWPELRELLETRGPGAVVARIAEFPARERSVLYRYARIGIALGDWEGKDLDAYVQVADAGIEWHVARARAGGDEARVMLDGANVMSFNLAADLADCWPGDDVERRRSHFERGRRAGEDCVAWREELDKPASSRQLGHWALGYHRLRLGDASGARTSFAAAVGYSAADADADAEGPSFAFVVNSGYEAIAAMAAGDEGARVAYGEAIAAFEAQLGDESTAEDARFGIDQLERVRGLVIT
ncbi:MAG: hypothetical protein ACE5GC_03760 [Acidimicrobiia bacterium]